jgi:hypothetical protein
MEAGKILWQTANQLLGRRFRPVEESEPSPEHQAYWVLRNGVPDLCCEQHRFRVTSTWRHQR